MLISNLHSSTVNGCGGELNQSGKDAEGKEGHRGYRGHCRGWRDAKGVEGIEGALMVHRSMEGPCGPLVAPSNHILR